jgi:hypothetical protein
VECRSVVRRPEQGFPAKIDHAGVVVRREPEERLLAELRMS